ncbi:hypothetical protein niasHS_015422 [Heterodera schachtii]|uniref:Uncharacterized protein n=1 Tax=Heterodera schachtii TaxID=97005 RepID=A0ABD2I9E9_HETSC
MLEVAKANETFKALVDCEQKQWRSQCMYHSHKHKLTNTSYRAPGMGCALNVAHGAVGHLRKKVTNHALNSTPDRHHQSFDPFTWRQLFFCLKKRAQRTLLKKDHGHSRVFSRKLLQPCG